MLWVQQTWTPEQRQVIEAIERLSAATTPAGSGAGVYADVLADDFSRWTVGSTVLDDKHSWVEGLRQWWDEGWRVADRATRFLEIIVRGDYAFVRRIVTETYLSPGGERSASTAALAEIWVWERATWRLLHVNVHPLEEG